MAVEAAPVEELMAVIRPAGLHTQKAPRIQATLRKIREERGDHSLEFLGEMDPLVARDWLTAIPGIDVVMTAADFDGKLDRANVVITGEGRIDAQTAFGKTALGVARRAADASVACIAVGGGVEPGGIEALRPLGAVVVPVVERPQTVAQAMEAGAEPLERCGERIARLVDLGRGLAPSSSS